MTPRLFIAIPVHNRLDIAEQCIPTVRAGMDAKDLLSIWNDGSALGGWKSDWELDQWFRGLTGGCSYHANRPAIGIEAQRRRHLMDFDQSADGFGYTHLYLTDPDAPHDPEWRSELLRLQDKYGGAPICGYNTKAHADLVGNTIEDDPAAEVIWRRYAPGISYLLTRAHVAKLMPHIERMTNFDWQIPDILGNRFAIARRSLCDHIGEGGIHHPRDAGFDGGDRALNPTPWLVAKRAEIVEKLKAKA